MTNPRTKLTVDDYMATPDDQRCQLLDGDLILAPAPTLRHQWISGRIFSALDPFVLLNGLGRVFSAPTDVVLSEHNVTQPDVLFIADSRAVDMNGPNIQGAPDLVVEILSPSTAEQDRETKRRLYGEHGVQEYWLVDPNANTIEVLTASETGLTPAATYTQTGILVSPLLQGLSIALEQIFSE